MIRPKVFIDTNVLIDYAAERAPFCENATKVIELCAEERILGAIAVHSLLNMFYILRNHIPDHNERRACLLDLAEIFEIVEINGEMTARALKNNAFKDFEDCVQAECAVKAQADYIVTRNVKDFGHSDVRPVTPEELLMILKDQNL